MTMPRTNDRSKKFLGQGWNFPIEVDQNNSRIVDIAYENSVRQAIWIIISTAKGERIMRPEFGCGIHDLVFEVNNASTHGMAEYEISEALRLWEPRIDVLKVNAMSEGAQGEQLSIHVAYKVLATDNRFNLVYPFYLDRGVV